MSLRLEVAFEAPSGEQLGLSGAVPSLGEWDLARVVRLGAEEDWTWKAELPISAGGSEFKLVALKGDDHSWEPLEDPRRLPSTGIGHGAVLRTRWGERRMVIEASAEHIQANARASRRAADRAGSALEACLQTKGDNAYYYAHGRSFEVPEDAKVISGPGLITGGQPMLIEAGANTVDPEAHERIVWLKEYSWSDSSSKVKVYVPVPEGVLPSEGAAEAVEASWGATRVELTIKTRPQHKLTIEKLNAEIKVESCKERVEAHKNRIVLELAKKRDTTLSLIHI